MTKAVVIIENQKSGKEILGESMEFIEVAIAVRLEHNKKTDTFYLVFEVTDEKFRNKIKKDWTQDIDLRVVNVQVNGKTEHKLVEFESKG